MVSEKRLKGHGGKHQEEVSKTAKYGGLFILVIMVLSIAGFALSMGGGYESSSDGSTNQNFPLTENAFQNSQTGEAYWGAVVNGERFIFMNGIEGYDNFENMANLASQVKSKSDQLLTIKVGSNFTNSDALYLIQEKLFVATNTQTQMAEVNSTCNENTILFTNELIENSNCMQFVAPQGEEANFADIFVYHMIK
jgi:hypothetical protein